MSSRKSTRSALGAQGTAAVETAAQELAAPAGSGANEGAAPNVVMGVVMENAIKMELDVRQKIGTLSGAHLRRKRDLMRVADDVVAVLLSNGIERNDRDATRDVWEAVNWLLG